jgi:hypothetical protein
MRNWELVIGNVKVNRVFTFSFCVSHFLFLILEENKGGGIGEEELGIGNWGLVIGNVKVSRYLLSHFVFLISYF